MKVDFSKLVGEEAYLYHNNIVNQFQLGSVIFEVDEDENDNSSSMGPILMLAKDAPRQDHSLGKVRIEYYADSAFTGYALLDVRDNFEWVKFGTDTSDECYPMFIFLKNARPPIEEELKDLIKL